jgi:hypothetical protein
MRVTYQRIRSVSGGVEGFENLLKTTVNERGDVWRVNGGARIGVDCYHTEQERFFQLFPYNLVPFILLHCVFYSIPQY